MKMKQKNKKVQLLLGNLLTSTGVKQPKSSNIPGQRVMRVGEGTIRAGEYFNADSSFN